MAGCLEQNERGAAPEPEPERSCVYCGARLTERHHAGCPLMLPVYVPLNGEEA